MSIYIKGLDIPQDGIVRVIMIESDGSVRFYGGSSVIARAIEVPPHGRLIDANALFQAMFQCQDGSIIGDKGIDGWPHEATYAEIKRFIRHAPTVIPADKAEEDPT